MKRTYSLFQQQIAYVLLISLSLQSCGGNLPISNLQPLSNKSCEEAQKQRLNDLPDEALQTILFHLSVDDRKSARQVNRRFRALVQDLQDKIDQREIEQEEKEWEGREYEDETEEFEFGEEGEVSYIVPVEDKKGKPSIEELTRPQASSNHTSKHEFKPSKKGKWAAHGQAQGRSNTIRRGKQKAKHGQDYENDDQEENNSPNTLVGYVQEDPIHLGWHESSKTCHETPNSYDEVLEIIKSNDPKIGVIDLSHIQEVINSDKLNILKEYVRDNSFLGWIHWGQEKDKHEGLKKEIEKILIQNICNYSYHPTDYVHGLFANQIYASPKQGDQVNLHALSQKLGHELPPNISNSWKVVQVMNDTENSGYCSALYVNEATHQAVLAFQGTKHLVKDLTEDLVNPLSNKIFTDQQKLTYEATKKAVEYAKHKGLHLSMTGHSLGAYLAELSIIFCYRKFNYKEVKAIVFDSPGIGEKAKSLKPNTKSKRTKFNPASLPILTYLSAPNVVNICNPHVGEIYRINPDLELEDWETIRKGITRIRIGGDRVPAILSIKGHSLEFILRTFNPITGKPTQRVRMDNWPRIKLASGFYDQRGKFLGTKGVIGRIAGVKFSKGLIIPRVMPSVVPVIMGYLGVIPMVGSLPGWIIMGTFSMLTNFVAGQAGTLVEDIVDKNFCLLNALIALGLDYQKIDLSQFWQTMRSLDHNYEMPDNLTIGDTFKLEFAGKYQPTSSDQVNVHALNTKSCIVDKYLYNLYKLKQNPRYEEIVGELSKTNFYVRLLKKISQDYNVSLDDEIKIEEGFIRLCSHQPDIEIIRDKMRRALEILTPRNIEIAIKNIKKSIEDSLVLTPDAELSSCIVSHHKKRLNKYTKQLQVPFQDPLLEDQVGTNHQQLVQQRNNPFKTAMVLLFIFLIFTIGFHIYPLIFFQSSRSKGTEVYPVNMASGNTMHSVNTVFTYGQEVKQDDVKAVELLEWVEEAANQGQAGAQQNLGTMYALGKGVKQDDAKAVEWYEKAASQGDSDAQYNLAVMYVRGKGVRQDDAKAVEWYEKAASQGHVNAQLSLGFMYKNGKGVRQDDVKAVEWYEKAANQGDSDAQYNVGFMYKNGKGVRQDDAKAVEWYEKAANQGDSDAQYMLAVMYALGKGVKQDDAKAVEWYEKAANQGHADAQYMLAVMYALGKGVKQDDVKVVEWYEKAANQGHADAQHNLGYRYELGKGAKQDHAKSAEWYEKAASQGHVNAQYNLGLKYEFGKGVKQDDVKAVEWYEKAASQGYVNAQYNLGFMYENGKGVKQDDVKAVEWYEKAASQGHAYAQISLGYMYEFGKGAKQDHAKSAEWFEKAANQGEVIAQYNLGLKYEFGQGVKQDDAKAIEWYEKAANQGDSDAQTKLEILKQTH